jgi:hypothetical protein
MCAYLLTGEDNHEELRTLARPVDSRGLAPPLPARQLLNTIIMIAAQVTSHDSVEIVKMLTGFAAVRARQARLGPGAVTGPLTSR